MKTLRIIVLIAVVLEITTATAFINQQNVKMNSFYFLKKFKKMPINGKLKIKDITADDPFRINLRNCMPGFYNGVTTHCDYFLEDAKKINDIGITEYVFKDTSYTEKAFRDIYAYAEKTRKLARFNYDQLCYALPEPQIYYASKIENHIFLYTIYYNFVYPSGKESIQTIFESNKQLLLDDIYEAMGQNN